MSKIISKQSVAIWYVLSALFATYIVGQVILWCFPDGSSLGGSLLFYPDEFDSHDNGYLLFHRLR